MKHLYKQLVLVVVFSLVLFSCQKEVVNDARIAENDLLNSAAIKLPSDSRAGSKTAQSVQVNVRGISRHYQILTTEPWTYQTWSYNWAERNDALASFDEYFTLTTSGNPSSGQIERGKHKAFQDNKCNFWYGTPLQVVSFIAGEEQPKTVTCTPKVPGTYPEKTGWTLEIVDGRSVDVHLTNIFVASASFLEKTTGSNSWSKKYSFSMRNDDLTSRLTDLKIELIHNGQVIETRTPDHTLQDNANWHYEVNAGIYGNPDVFYAFDSGVGSDKSVNAIQRGEGDDFPGNDNEGGSRALIPEQTFSGLTLEGNYSVRISGVVKGNSFTADKLFSISQDLVSEGCHDDSHDEPH
ncbi:hypothetical protein ACFSQD_01755 [Flavihumibacter stibioxidans]|uniref:Fimbrillin family protein n=1 Tax=Flavihumibacter stibioxidans TaxID=1834163 RepID=A0ABR7MAY6_9BACT|nr:hypothetical protein [Flavihumibacter stibioxidans]MBC6492207.1 hypothetical protein [Flavihumibacter stibioxidans]